MFFIFLILFLLVFLECFLLYRKKIIKMSIILLVFNIITMLISLLILKGKFNYSYSSIIYMEYLLKNNFILFILWMILFIFYAYYLLNILNKAIKRKVQIKILSYLIKLLLYFILLVFIRIILGNSFVVFSFIVTLFIIGLLIIKIIYNKKKPKLNYLVFGFIFFLILLSINIYFSVDGAIRYAIFLKGYPRLSLSINYEELTYYKNDKNIKYELFSRIPGYDTEYNLIEVSNTLIKNINFIG